VVIEEKEEEEVVALSAAEEALELDDVVVKCVGDFH